MPIASYYVSLDKQELIACHWVDVFLGAMSLQARKSKGGDIIPIHDSEIHKFFPIFAAALGLVAPHFQVTTGTGKCEAVTLWEGPSEKDYTFFLPFRRQAGSEYENVVVGSEKREEIEIMRAARVVADLLRPGWEWSD
jgi:hypothetical protein